MAADLFRLPPAEWAALRALLDEGLALPAAEREPWVRTLDPARAGDLKPHLARLLAQAGADPGTAERLLQTLAGVETGSFAPAPQAPTDTVGPYRLLRPLGEGGMGSVWLAERSDMLQRRQVALKLPHGTWRRRGLAERLAREREILAPLDHPHIARLHDAGVDEQGQPYLALEYVEGEPLDAWCARHAPPLRRRLQLFLQVAQAVAYAHGRLVVHRDLKPANILVTADGQAKLLDFGIAKLLDDGSTDETELTREAGRPFTPDYASPEQIMGQPLGTSSDVYSLGVVLYELLAGQRPYRLERATPAALAQAVAALQVVRPSQRAPAAARRALQGDLDAIVLKALQPDSTHRYATVAALADDVQRHLDGRPVAAQPDRAWYRIGRLLRRHRLAVGAGAGIALALFAGTGVALWQAREARAQSERAEEARRLVESIFVQADPIREAGRPLTAVELLRQAQARVAGLQAIDPVVRLGLLNAVATSMLNLHDVEGAEAVLREAAVAAREVPAGDNERHRMRRLGALLASAQGRVDEARRIIAEALPQLEAHPERHGDELLATLQAAAQIENEAARYAEARAAAERLIVALERLGRQRSPFMVSALSQLANAHDYLRRADDAHAAALRAHQLARELHPGSESHPLVNSTRMMLAKTLADRDDLDAAIDLMRQAQRTAAAMFGADSRVAGRYSGMMTSYLGGAGHAREALASSQHALKVLGPTFPQDSLAYAALLDQAAAAALANQDGAAALEAATTARDIIVAAAGPDHESAFVMQVYRARAAILLGRPADAAAWLQEMLERYRRKGVSGVSTPAHFLGVALRLMGQPAQALALQQQALQAVRPGPRARRLGARILVETGLCHLALGEPERAAPVLAEALATLQDKYRVTTPDHAAARLGLAQVALARQRPAEALPLAEQAEAFWRDFKPGSRAAGEAAFWHGRVLAALGRPAEAQRAMARAAEQLAGSTMAVDLPLQRAAAGSL